MDDAMEADLEELYRRLLDGEFYQDYDEDGRLMGRLREHLKDK